MVSARAEALIKLFGHEIIFEAFQPMWSWYLYLNVLEKRTDGRTDRRHIVWHNDRAVCSITR